MESRLQMGKVSSPKDKAARAGRANVRSGGGRVGAEKKSRKPEATGAPSSVVGVWV